jgi:hypothetical protein
VGSANFIDLRDIEEWAPLSLRFLSCGELEGIKIPALPCQRTKARTGRPQSMSERKGKAGPTPDQPLVLAVALRVPCCSATVKSRFPQRCTR